MNAPFVDRLRAELLNSAQDYHKRQRRLPRRVAFVLAVASFAMIALLVAREAGDSGGEVSGEAESSRSGDGRSTRVVTSQPSSASTEPAASQNPRGIVNEFIGQLRRGDVDAAATLWSGYPDSLGDPERKAVLLAGLLAEYAWLSGQQPYDLLEVSAADTVSSVVTVVSDVQSSQERVAAAFVVDETHIQRLPHSSATRITPEAGSSVAPGDLVTLSGVPTEGGAAVHVNGIAVTPSIDHDNVSTTIELPESIGNEALVIFSFATPELPTADAYWYSVRGA